MRMLWILVMFSTGMTLSLAQGGAETNDWISTTAVSNVFIQFLPNRAKKTFSPTEPIKYLFRGTSGWQEIIELKEFFECKLECVDQSGHFADRTSKGKEFGSKFERADADPAKYRRSGSQFALFGVGPENVAVREIPAPDTLFQLYLTNSYTLNVELQCVWRGRTNDVLIKFKPVRLKLAQ